MFADRGQHLDLGGDVERGGGLVEDDEVGAAGHRHRRHRPLELPARDLVGIAEADLLGVRQLHPAVEVHASASALSRDMTPWTTGASQYWSMSLWAGLKLAAADCAT
jgi:hypothetical protein